MPIFEPCHYIPPIYPFICPHPTASFNSISFYFFQCIINSKTSLFKISSFNPTSMNSTPHQLFTHLSNINHSIFIRFNTHPSISSLHPTSTHPFHPSIQHSSIHFIPPSNIYPSISSLHPTLIHPFHPSIQHPPIHSILPSNIYPSISSLPLTSFHLFINPFMHACTEHIEKLTGEVEDGEEGEENAPSANGAPGAHGTEGRL